MSQNITSITIETLILVAIWKKTPIFQGRFTIAYHQNQYKKHFYYRCESNLNTQMEMLNEEFSPNHYKITDLYCQQKKLNLNDGDIKIESALYLLKHALYLTIKQMLVRSKTQYASIDKIAMASFSKQIEQLIIDKQEEISNHEIGFAVSVVFSPTEVEGRSAMNSLAALGNSGSRKNCQN